MRRGEEIKQWIDNRFPEFLEVFVNQERKQPQNIKGFLLSAEITNISLRI